MADAFKDPASQANLDRLLASLKAKDAELEAVLQQARQSVAEFGTMSRETIAQTRAQARELSAARPAQTGTGTVRETTGTVKELAAAERTVNAALERQITLRREALTVAREQLGATQKVGVGAAAPQAGTFGGQPGAPSMALMSAAAGPPRIPLMTAPGSRQSAAAAAKEAEEARLFAEAQRGAAEGTTALSAAKQRDILYTHQLDNELQRHGAMTSEFLAATMRGQVTLREFGNQMATTIGKFGGWTVAAGAVYGVIGAVQELGSGAIEAQDAAGNLTRTIETGFSRPQATQQVIQTAREANVTMKEAGDAAFLFSRTFHDSADATYVAGLALKSYKLDGVSVTDQVKAMTAIHQQFQVSAQGMAPVWGLLANGQREFNARVNEMIPALIGSATAVRNAGGDLTDYVKILQIALRVTQLSGAQLGTAFRRAPTFLNRPTSQAGLKALGFDPKQAVNDFTDFIKEVMQRSPSMSGDDRRKLFTDIFGPQFGQRMAGLSNVDPKLYQEVMGQSVTSAAPLLTEFSKLLGTPREQLKAIVNNVQQVGAELGESGLLHPLGLVVRLLNEGLRVTEDMLKVWSQLPAPVREMGGYLAAFMTARGIAGRLNIGIPGIGPSANRQAGTQIETGIKAEKDFYATQMIGAQRASGIAKQEVDRLAIARNAAVATGASKEEQIAAQRAYEAGLARAATAEARIGALKTESAAAAAREVAYQEGINRGLASEEAAIAAGYNYRLGTLQRGGRMPEPIPISGEAKALEAERAAMSRSSSTGGLVIAGAGSRASSAEATTKAAAEASATLEGTVKRTGWLRAGLDTLGSSIGRMVLPIMGIALVGSSIKDAMDHADDAAKEASTALAKLPRTSQDVQATAQALQHASRQAFGEQGPAWMRGIPIFGSIVQAGMSLGNTILGRTPDNYSYGSQPEEDYALWQQLMGPKRNVKHVMGRMTQMPSVAGGGEPGFADRTTFEQGTFQGMIDDANKAAQTIPHTLAGYKQWQGYQKNVMTQARGLADQLRSQNAGDPEALRTIEAALASLGVSLKQIATKFVPSLHQVVQNGQLLTLQHMKPETVMTGMQAAADRIKLFGASSGEFQDLIRGYLELKDRFRNSRDPKQLEQVIQAQALLADSVTGDVQNLMQAASLATTRRGQLSNLGRARALLLSRIRMLHNSARGLGVQMEVSGVTIAEAQAGLQMIEQNMISAGADAATSIPQLTQTPEWAGGKPKKGRDTYGQAEKAYQDVLKRLRERMSSFGQLDKQSEDQFDQLLKQINQQERQTKKSDKSTDPYNLARLRSEIAQARAEGDPVRQAQIAQHFAEIERRGAHGENEKLQAELDMVQADNQYWQAVQARAQAVFDVRESQTTDPVKIAELELQKAQQTVNALKRRGLTGTQGWDEAVAARNKARQSLVDTKIQTSEDNIKFALDMGDISVQTAINEYRALLHMHNITRQKRQEILEQIRAWQQQGQSDFSALDLGSIRLPTPYEIRRGLLGAQGGMTVRQSNTVHVNVTNPAAAGAVGVVLDRYVNGTGKAIDRAGGGR